VGSLAIVTSDKLKYKVTESTVAFGSVAVGQTELGVFVGANLIADLGLYKSIASAVEKCTNALRDVSNPAPALAANFNLSEVDPTNGLYGVKDVTVTLNSVTGLPTGEDSVTIIVGGLHQSESGDSITDSVKRGFEKILEDRLKKAA
jgi:hypothetical protein